MKKIVLFTLILSILCLPAAAEMRISEAVITTGVVERMPVDSVQTYPASVERLYCFTHVTGSEGETFIVHVWYLADEEMARVNLPVRSPNWRTWSTKSFRPQWRGEWRVEILDPQGNLLDSVPFILN